MAAARATTTPKVRAAIQTSDEPASVLAARFGTTGQTVCKWKHRDTVHDRKRIDAILDIERDINGLDPKARLEARSRLSAPLLAGHEAWLRSERARMPKHNPVAKAINTLFEKDHWPAFTRFLTDGRVCLTSNAAERSLRGTALGRKAWLFAGSDRGGNRTAFMYSLIVTAKMNDIDPQAWRADVLARMPALTVSRLPELLPWNWHHASSKQKAA